MSQSFWCSMPWPNSSQNLIKLAFKHTSLRFFQDNRREYDRMHLQNCHGSWMQYNIYYITQPSPAGVRQVQRWLRLASCSCSLGQSNVKGETASFQWGQWAQQQVLLRRVCDLSATVLDSSLLSDAVAMFGLSTRKHKLYACMCIYIYISM